jgi:4-hydroxy-tetrahydrodipicolinate synthase
MHPDGTVDHEGLTTHIERLDDAGVHGIFPCGTIGERPTLEEAEAKEVIETAVDATSKPVVAGTGASSTASALDRTHHAASVGAEAAIILNPPNSAPKNEFSIRHYTTIADEVGIPIYLYNYPKQGGPNLEPETTAKLAEHSNIVGIKESCENIHQIYEILHLTEDLDFNVLSGYDSEALPILLMGGTGVTSVSANIFPEDIVKFVEATFEGDIDDATRLQRKMIEIEKMVRHDNPPIIHKKAIELLGHHEANVRAPLYDIDPEHEEKLRDFLDSYEPESTH